MEEEEKSKCPFCKNDINFGADTCASCGAYRKEQKKLSTLLWILLFMFWNPIGWGIVVYLIFIRPFEAKAVWVKTRN